MSACARCPRRSPRTNFGRRAWEILRHVGQQIVRLRLDAGISQRQLAAAAGIPQSYLWRIERGEADPSTAVLIAIGTVLGADLSIRLMPGSGARIRDRFQAPIVDALVQRARGSWRPAVEVPVWRPVRGVIDTVLARPAELVIAGEVHSEIRRIEQQLRWAMTKSESLPSAEAWSLFSGGDPTTPISRLLVLRSTPANREIAATYESLFLAAYPARTEDAIHSLGDAKVAWPGAALIWATVDHRGARILEGPPRGVNLGR